MKLPKTKLLYRPPTRNTVATANSIRINKSFSVMLVRSPNKYPSRSKVTIFRSGRKSRAASPSAAAKKTPMTVSFAKFVFSRTKAIRMPQTAPTAHIASGMTQR